MSLRMRRKEFLIESSRAVLGLSLPPLLARAKGNQKSGELKNRPSETLIADLERLIPKLMEEALVPGLSIVLIKDAKLFWRRGFGVKDSASKEPVDNETIFEAASVSKTVFAYAVMKLCERGVIGLDTPLTKYAPKPFLEGDARLELITARHVLCHTTGFQNWRSDKEPLKIHFTPGEKHMYSGEGYSYLQSVVTQVTGQPIEPYMKARLLSPFGMSSSGYAWNDMFEKRMARPHDQNGKPIDNNKPTAKEIARYAAA
ncbi:MAG TPA: serine hydrolase, partial [Blastocatellia bacterium]|nr:serine hydrolase [Blastocatellia bacterium]